MNVLSQRTPSISLALAGVYVALIVYASLYPFVPIQDLGISPWAFFSAPLVPYWTGFDVTINVLAYIPLGFLLTWRWLTHKPGQTDASLYWSGLCALLFGICLSASQEMLQTYLPSRVPSKLDWWLNSLGTFLGVTTVYVLRWLNVLLPLDVWMQTHFQSSHRGTWVLLSLWPFALLFPTPLPFGLGHISTSVWHILNHIWGLLPWTDNWPWPELKLSQLPHLWEYVCIALGVLIPCLFAQTLSTRVETRVVLTLLISVLACALTTLTYALRYGPDYASYWFTPTARISLGLGLFVAVAAAIGLCRKPFWVTRFIFVIAMIGFLVLINQAGLSAYSLQSLQTWGRGDFLRFYGLSQWLTWLWPYAALFYMLRYIPVPPEETD